MSIRKWGAHVKAIFGEIDHQHRKDTDNASMLLSKISSIKGKNINLCLSKLYNNKQQSHNSQLRLISGSYPRLLVRVW